MIYVKIITHDDITPVVSKIAEQIGRIQGELIESDVVDVIGMRKTLIQVQSSLLDIRRWADELYH